MKFLQSKIWLTILFWVNLLLFGVNFIAAFILMELGHDIKWVVLFAIVNLIGMRACYKKNELDDKIQKMKDDIMKRRIK